MNSNKSKTIDYFLSLNYEITLRKMTAAEAGTSKPCYFARIPLIDGLMSEGSSPEEALHNLEKVKKMAFELLLKQGKNIPEPLPETIPA